jgi:hypothetical protein
MLSNKTSSNAYANSSTNGNTNYTSSTNTNTNANAYTNRRARIRSGIRNYRTVSSGVFSAEKEEEVKRAMQKAMCKKQK